MTRHVFQTLRDEYLADPAEQAAVAELSRATRVLAALAHLADPEHTADTVTNGECAHFRDDDSLFLTTLREGIEQLGGRLEIAAVFPHQRVPLNP